VFAWVVHGHNGLCDLTITGPTRVTEVREGQVRTFEVEPGMVGLECGPLEALLVDSPRASAAAMRAILSGADRGPRRRHGLLNAGAALVVAGLADDLKAGLAMAAEAVDAGEAMRTLERLAAMSFEPA
jgi:anthranilate phosphoribosyltransferase